MTATAPLEVRLELDPYVLTAIPCLLQAQIPNAWRAQPLNIRVGIFQNGVWVDSLANYTSIHMEIHPHSSGAGAALVTKTVLVAAMATPTESQWDAGTHQHATFELDSTDTNFDLTGAANDRLSFWMVFYATLTSGDTPPLGFTTPTFIESKAALSLGVLGASQPNYQVTTRQLLCVKGASGSLYPLTVDETKTIPTLTIGGAL